MKKGTRKVCSRGHVFYKTSDCPACPVCWKGFSKKKPKTDLPAIGAPATRALNGLNATKLIHLKKFTQEEIAEQHGVGPTALARLKHALNEKGWSFKKR